MKIYWSDREGNLPPAACTFSFRPFSSVMGTPPHTQQMELPPPVSSKVVKKTYLPTRDEWTKGVNKALEFIRKGELQKVVLARICRLELDQAPDPFAITAALKQKAQGAFVFCMQSDSQAFLGATPERLFFRKKRKIISEAVAGTRKRGSDPIEDEKLQQELLNSAKDLREFSPVQTYLQSALSPLCLKPIQFTPIHIHQTKNVQHLYSKCTGDLREDVTDEEILANLHPTPALCGTPKQKAFSFINELEPFDRGLYGGALGWSTPEASEWIVGIRSCLIEGNVATLFSGTGIVEGSNPDDEWDELNQKLKLYEGILDY